MGSCRRTPGTDLTLNLRGRNMRSVGRGSDPVRRRKHMPWTIEAKYYEACNCELGCPCNMNGFPSHGACEGSIAYAITSGNRDGVDLSGAKVAMAIK